MTTTITENSQSEQEKKQVRKERAHQWYLENCEKVKAKSRATYYANPNRSKIQHKLYFLTKTIESKIYKKNYRETLINILDPSAKQEITPYKQKIVDDFQIAKQIINRLRTSVNQGEKANITESLQSVTKAINT